METVPTNNTINVAFTKVGNELGFFGELEDIFSEWKLESDYAEG